MAEKVNQEGNRGHHAGEEQRGETRPAPADEVKKRRHKLYLHHRQTLWVYWLLIILGIWMVLSPLTFSYGIGTVEPSGGREVWLSMSERVTFMKWSDIISGLLLIFLGWRSLTPNRPFSLWICCFTGIWISMAPLLFWAPTAVSYLNGTMVGAFVIALSILIPGIPNKIMFLRKGSEIPAGWSYNPSSWPQRWILIVMGFLGWMASRYLGAYQMGYIDYAWDPFFGGSTVAVLDSSLSHSFPVSDAALGSLAYTIEFLMGFMGGTSRFRTMPWMVTIFGILVIPLGLVSIILVISQPLIVGAWCTICLATAIFMLPMIPFEIDEVVATVYDLVERKRRGEDFWDIFWKGAETEDQTVDKRSPDLLDLPHNFREVFRASIWGISFPPTLTATAILGIWLMFVPGIFGLGIENTAANICHLFGALIVVVSVISMAEVVRIVRYVNIFLGLAVVGAFIFFADAQTVVVAIAVLTGLIVAALAIPRGKITESYGPWDKFVR